MKKIYDGMVYDTEKAERIADYEYSDSEDFFYVREVLYKTKNGRYFLYGEGGSKTDYLKKVGLDNFSSGSMIIPYVIDEILSWAEDRNINSQKLVDELSDYLEEA